MLLKYAFGLARLSVSVTVLGAKVRTAAEVEFAVGNVCGCTGVKPAMLAAAPTLETVFSVLGMLAPVCRAFPVLKVLYAFWKCA